MTDGNGKRSSHYLTQRGNEPSINRAADPLPILRDTMTPKGSCIRVGMRDKDYPVKTCIREN